MNQLWFPSGDVVLKHTLLCTKMDEKSSESEGAD